MSDATEHTQRPVGADIVAELSAEGFDDAGIVGRGGFGIVYRCWQAALDRLVAVKVLSQDPDHMDRARFLREQQAMGRLSGHPNIVTVLQAGITDTGRPYIVMPFHRRDSLDSWILKKGALTPPEVLAVGVKLAGALETAHRGGVLHRDIKPANILLTEYGEPQLTDFGIARIIGREETTEHLLVGSPAYVAPELLSGSDASAVTDVYSLGATLFTALAGSPAYSRRHGEQVFAQLLRISTDPLPDLRNQGIPDAVCMTIESAMARDPADRPATAAELGVTLRAAGEQIGLTLADLPLPLSADDDRPFLASNRVIPADQTRSLPNRGSAGTLLRDLRPPSASTKYRPPVTPGVTVTRTHLLERLSRSGRPRLVLIHAPAGFGKSTLAAQRIEMLGKEGLATAWLTIDNDDNTLIWFLTHMIDAIVVAQPGLGRELVQELEMSGEGREKFVLTSLIDKLHSADQHVALVIDDWHRVTNDDTRSAMAFLLEHGCHHLHLIVTSRTRLGLPLSTMSVHNELIEIDATALRFDVRESRRLLTGRSGLELDEADVVDLEQTTDGWAAALQLVSLALRDHPHPRELIEHLSGGNRAIGDYLTENVLDSLDAHTLDFILATSITEKICDGLARALTGTTEGQAALEDIESRDLFLRRLDDEGEWFRYHHLFAEFLRRRLGREPERIVDLHRRAGQWFADQQLLSQAIDHYLLAGDEQAAVTLVESAAMELLEQSQMGTLLGLAAKLPAKRTTPRARLQIALAWANTLLHHPREAEQLLSIVETALECGADDSIAGDMRAEAAFIRATIAVFDDQLDGIDEAVEGCVARANTLHPWVLCGAADVASFHAIHRFDFAEALRWQRWALPFHHRSTGPFSVIYGYCMAGIAAREQLDLPAAEASFRYAMDLATEAEEGLGYGTRLTAALLGDLLYEQGHLVEADRLLDRSHTLGAEGGVVDFMLATYGTGARLKKVLGQQDAAKARLDEGARLAQRLRLPRLAARVANERIRAGSGHVGSNDPGLVEERRTRHDGIATVTMELEEDSAIRAALTARTDAQGIDVVCERAHALAESIDPQVRPRAFLNAALLHVETLATAGRDDAALTALLPLAEQCARLGLVRPLPDAGPATIRTAKKLRLQLPERGGSTALAEYLADLQQPS